MERFERHLHVNRQVPTGELKSGYALLGDVHEEIKLADLLKKLLFIGSLSLLRYSQRRC